MSLSTSCLLTGENSPSPDANRRWISIPLTGMYMHLQDKRVRIRDVSTMCTGLTFDY